MKGIERGNGQRGERDREVKGIDRVKGAQSKILVKSPEPVNEAQRKVEYKNQDAINMSRNYYRKLSQKIITSISMTQKMWELEATDVSKNC